MNNNRKGITIVGDKKLTLTMAFKAFVLAGDYVKPEDCLKRKAHCKNVILQEAGFLLCNDVLLNEETVVAIQEITPHLTLGEIISFKANIVLENLEFISPVSVQKILKSDEDQIDGGNNG